ncbi:MAG: hypothetical protein ACYDC8_14660 [Gammaproteobacteria bacterium]
MKTLRTLALLAAAILATRIAITLVGVLISLSQLIAELSPNELQRMYAYKVIIAYCAMALLLTLAAGMLIYLEAKHRSPLRLTHALAPMALFLYGTHLAYAYVIKSSNVILMEFVKGFSWLPILAVLVVVVLLSIGHSEARRAR